MSVTGIELINLVEPSVIETLTENWNEDTPIATIKADVIGINDIKRVPYKDYSFISIMTLALPLSLY